MRLSPGDIPESWTDQTECYYSTMVWRGHRYCELASREMGRPLKEIPFRAGVYVINNGENHSKRSHNIGWRRKVVRAMTPTFRINDRLRNEFHLEVPSPMERALSTC